MRQLDFQYNFKQRKLLEIEIYLVSCKLFIFMYISYVTTYLQISEKDINETPHHP